MDNREMAAVGAGIAAIAAGAYFFFGPDGSKHQKKMKGWMVKMKGDVLEKLEDAIDVTEPIYNDIVDSVARTQAVAGKIPKTEIMALAIDLKKQWRTISRSVKGTTPKRAPARRSVAKKAPAKRKPAVRKTNNNGK